MEKDLYGWKKSEAYLEPSRISKMELFMKIMNGSKVLTISAKTLLFVMITYIPGQRFYLSIF